ncbi:MAG: amino acid adenylation domain-containing protein [Magnetococcus sp. DMHC-1]
MMQEVTKFVQQLRDLGVTLTVEAGRLRYGARKGVLTPELLEKLASCKAEVIACLEQEEARQQARLVEQPIPVMPRTQSLPLSFAQQRLWFLDQLEQGRTTTYIMPPLVMRLRGELHQTALEQALDTIIQRHEVLHSAFRIEGDHPVQDTSHQVTLTLPLVDLQHLPPEQQNITIEQVTREQASTPFDLSSGNLLLRVKLLRLHPTEHVFILTMHHIIADGWSIGVFVRELSTLYHARLAGQPSPLPPLPIQYADYAHWERQRFQGAFLEQEKNYWRKQLAHAPALLELPTDFPRPRVQRFRGKTEYLYFTKELTRKLNQFCVDAKVTLFMALLGAFAALLSRYSRQEDIVIGSPIANRNHSQTENLIGLFLNTLVLRVNLQGGPDFVELLARIKQMTLGAFEHQELPFEQLLEDFNLERNLNVNPLFQVLFVLQNAPLQETTLAGLTLTPMPTENINAVVDLVLSMEETPQGLEAKFRYNTDLFKTATIQRLAGHFHTLLTGMIQEPHRPVASIPLLTPAETQQIQAWNNTRVDYPLDKCLHAWFEAQAGQTPDATALVLGEARLSYRELNVKANQLAHHLRQMEVGPGVLVGVCLERSLEMVIGLYGTLKAGGAYVPLDPDYPTERLQFMLDDARVPVLLTQTPLLPLLEKLNLSTTRILCLDTAGFFADPATPIHDPDVAVTPSHPAYVIYTSGSTGRPKGVVNIHRAICNRLLWMQEAFPLTAADHILQKTTFSFDVSVWEFFWPLMVGARLVLARPGGHKESDYLVRLIQEQKITTLHFVPSMLQIFLQASGLEACHTLKRVICSGEALRYELQEQFFSRLPASVELHNLYGPTEAAVDVTHWPCQRNLPLTTVPIGRPIANIRIHILDAALQIVPVGVPGELHIAGVGLATGYLNRPALTREKFIPDPFSPDPDARLYKTGDLARWRPDGAIDYLGRLDFQVKLRGFRIELGEIEALLLQQTEVADAVVVVRQDGGEDSAQMVAYLVAQPGATLSIPGLRQYLKEKLAEYMIPAAFVVLPHLPLTESGKVNRKALPSPDVNRRDLETTFVPPTTPLEQLLAGLWTDILQIKRIGIHDNFFELGGDSIKGAVFVNKLQELIKKVVYVVALFEAPTIAQFVGHLGKHYPEVLATLGGEPTAATHPAPEPVTSRLDATKLERFCRLIPPLPPRTGPQPAQKNPPAIFVLAPPRSGTTLLRVLLGGHPDLFGSPELELLSFNTLPERRAAYSGRNSFSLEGTLRALMEIRNFTADEAKALMEEYEGQGMTVQALYRQMQLWLGNKILLDKSPAYALDRRILERAEADFQDPLYIHLLRHPCGMIHSFEEVKLHHVFFRFPHDFTGRELAEMIWLHSHRNILEFFQTVPKDRQFTLKFEDLTRHPEPEIKRLCQFLNIDFHPDMLRPYKEKKQRMTDGIYPESKMLGDVKFHQHKKIDDQVAERWKQTYQHDFLGAMTWSLAESFGYERWPVPLSFAQQRLWFLDQLEGASATYSMPIALRLQGPLHRQALQQGLQTLVERHATLRSRFPTVDGLPTLQIAREPLVWRVEDLQNQSSEEQQCQVQAMVGEDATTPFVLATGPLFRATLLILGERDHVILVNMHHIVSDGWSIGILMREWSQLYVALAEGRPSPLAPLAWQYVDYAAWQRQWLTGDLLKRQVDYWQRQLAGAPALLELPTDFPRPPVQRFRGDLVKFVVASTWHARLKKFGQEVGASLFMTLAGIFATLLARYSRQTDLVIGFPTANRTLREVESLMGFFVNTLVLRLDLSGNPGPLELLQQVRRVALEAYAHQDIPFEKLVEEVKAERNLSHSPLFQVMLVLQNMPMGIPELPGLQITNLAQNEVIAKFDLTLYLEETAQGLAGTLEYNTDLFARATVERLGVHFQTLLESFVNHPQQSIHALPLLTGPEQVNILETWNQTCLDYPRDKTLPDLLEIQGLATPTAPAVQFGNITLTYDTLNRRANQLAHHLQSLGVGPNVLVGIYIERSLEMVLGLLAVLKAGGAYVPLDPAYPAERLAFILQDAGVHILLTQEKLRKQLPATPAHTLCLDTQAAPFARASQDNPTRLTGPSDLAYVIYTSGSTGQPKGVMIPQRAVVNFLHAMQHTLALTPADRLLSVTTMSFDIFVLELYLPLCVGARVMLASQEMVRDAALLWQTMQQDNVTIMQATPATWRALLASGWERMDHLQVLCGGEALPRELAEQILARCGSLWNMYGPTETTVWSAMRRVTREEVPAGALEPIGRPIANTQIYILDPVGNPVPVGVAGELCIGGDGLALGYCNRPELTAEKFISTKTEDPAHPGSRLYKTGDLARFLPDGTLDYLRRMDNQVKLRGFRIELGEIESVLLQHPAVRECVVIVHTDGAGEQRLVAYCVPRSGEMPERVELRRFLQDHLPEYMLPTQFVALDALPLTPNGKVNRRALPPPESIRGPAAPQSLTSRDTLELKLIQIWEEVLQTRPIGIRDNFFDLGGHSLLAVRLMAKISQHCQRHLPLATLFQGSTIEQLAHLLRQQPDPAATWSSVVTIQPSGSKPPFFCAAGAGGNVLYFHELARHLDPERPFHGLQPIGLDGKTQPLHRVEDLAAHYIQAIKTIQPLGPYHLGGHSFGGLVAFEMARQLLAAGESVARLAILDAPAPHHVHPTGLDWTAAQWLTQVARIIGHLYQCPLDLHPEQLATLDPEAQLHLLHDQLQRHDILPPAADIAHFRGFVAVYKANLQVQYTPPLAAIPVPLTLFRSRDLQPDDLVTESSQTVRNDPTLGWTPYGSTPVAVHVIPGDHLTMMQSPQVDILAEKLRELLD